jgi:hypothetical protein
MEIEEKMERGEFLEIGSPTATLRLIRDLKSIKMAKREELGFDAEPVKTKGGLRKTHFAINSASHSILFLC